MLFAASRIQSKLAAIHIELEKGIAIKAKLAIKAPIKKNGFLLPNFGDQVSSLIAPKTGFTKSHVTGPANHNMGNSASFAPW